MNTPDPDGILELLQRDDGLMEPVNEADLPMFMHCTEGSTAITYSYFQNLIPVFACHGWARFKRFKDNEWEFLRT